MTPCLDIDVHVPPKDETNWYQVAVQRMSWRFMHLKYFSLKFGNSVSKQFGHLMFEKLCDKSRIHWMSGFIWQNFGFLSRFLNLLRIQQYIRRVSLQQPAQSALIVNKREPSSIPTISADKCKTVRRWFGNQVGTVCVSLSTVEEICRMHKCWMRRLCFPPFGPSAVDNVYRTAVRCR